MYLKTTICRHNKVDVYIPLMRLQYYSEMNNLPNFPSEVYVRG